MTTTYRGFKIGQTLGRVPTFYVVNDLGWGLFYGIESAVKARKAVDDLLFLRMSGR